MEIKYLSENKEYIPIVSEWIYREFVKGIRPNMTIKKIQGVLNLCRKDKFPITLIAIENKKCVATVSIFKNDLKTLNYTPWLGSLYVAKEYRNKGIGAILISKVIDISISLGYSKLYLRTENASEYYSRLGWKYLMTTKDEVGQITDVFTIE